MKSSTFFLKGSRLLKGSRQFALASVTVVGALAISSSFAAAVSSTATTNGEVVEPIAIATAQNLSFGKFSAGTGGTVVLSTAGAASSTGDVVVTGGTAMAAQFTVTGSADASFSIAVADDDLTHTTDALKVMTLTTTHDLDGTTGGNPTSGVLTLGTQTIYVGGTLTVASNQAGGVYSGTITATVNYN